MKLKNAHRNAELGSAQQDKSHVAWPHCLASKNSQASKAAGKCDPQCENKNQPGFEGLLTDTDVKSQQANAFKKLRNYIPYSQRVKRDMEDIVKIKLLEMKTLLSNKKITGRDEPQI